MTPNTSDGENRLGLKTLTLEESIPSTVEFESV